MKILLIIPIILGLTYCTSTQLPDGKTDSIDIENSIDTQALTLESIRLLVEDGSLSSLNEAINLIEDGNVRNTEKGSFYKIIILSLIKLVYPYSANAGITVNYPKNGILAELVEKAGKGEILDISKQKVDFFTLLLESTSALHTESEVVIIQSLDILDTIYNSDSNLFLPIFIKAYIKEKNKEYNEALKGYKKALEIDSFSYPAELGIIRILIRNSEFNLALKHINNIIKLYDKEPIVQYLYIDALIGNNQLIDAANIVSSYLVINPDNIELTLRYADILQREGKNSQASHLIQAIESISDNTPYSFFIKASIMFNNKNYSNAYSLLKVAVDEFPENIKLRNLYAKVLLVTGKTEAGREYLEDSFKINPSGLGSLRLLIEEAISSKDWNRAEGYIKKLLTNDNSDSSLRYAVLIYMNLKDNLKALVYNSKILERGHALHPDYLISTTLLIENGKRLKALKEIESWLEKSENSDDKSYFYYLRSLAQTNSQEKLDSLRQSLFENLQNLDAILAIADVYYNLNEKRSSYRYLKQALIISGNNKVIKEKLRKLEKEM